MFLAWNEIKRNKIKFSLVIGILVLISYLLFLLSGLANGLIKMNTEGIEKWNADAIILKKDANQTVQVLKLVLLVVKYGLIKTMMVFKILMKNQPH